MLEPGQRGRMSRWSHDDPGSRVTPWQGNGPQPITEPKIWARIALGDHNVPSESSSPCGLVIGG